LWGFTPRFNTGQYAPSLAYDRVRTETGFKLPESRYIEAFLKLVDFSKIRLSGDAQSGYTLTKLIQPGQVDGVDYQAQLDFGGIAKGYAVDRVNRLLQDRGYAYGSFSCGGSSIALLKNASKRSLENGTYRFALGLRKPRNSASTEDIYMSVATKDVLLSSSGDYDHCYVVDGVIYSHIIHPRTGYPMNTPVSGNQKGMAVLTLLSDMAGYSDALTTALCLLDFDAALRFMNEKLHNAQVVLVLYDSKSAFYEVVTSIPEAEFEIHDTIYRLASHLDSNGNILYDGTLLR
jgi:thiamine biosynthesis lipoprotein